MKAQKLERPFREWKEVDLQNYFGLVFQEKMPLLEAWLKMDSILTDEEITFLQRLREEAKLTIKYWNEMELRQRFIIPITNLVQFYSYPKKLNYFAERSLSVVIQNPLVNAKIYGVVDWLVATGLQDPQQPFFFIHEYKSVDGKASAGLGQLLATMLVAQTINDKPPKPTLFNMNPLHFYKDIPIYGAYVVGQLWYFLVLHEKEYSISEPFVCTKEDDLQAILKILKTQKQLIYSHLEKSQTN